MYANAQHFIFTARRIFIQTRPPIAENYSWLFNTIVFSNVSGQNFISTKQRRGETENSYAHSHAEG